MNWKWLPLKGEVIMWKRLTLEGEIVGVQVWGEIPHRIEMEKVEHHISEKKTHKLWALRFWIKLWCRVHLYGYSWPIGVNFLNIYPFNFPKISRQQSLTMVSEKKHQMFYLRLHWILLWISSFLIVVISIFLLFVFELPFTSVVLYFVYCFHLTDFKVPEWHKVMTMW